MENHHFIWENPLFQWPFSIAFCMFTRPGNGIWPSGVIKPGLLEHPPVCSLIFPAKGTFHPPLSGQDFPWSCGTTGGKARYWTLGSCNIWWFVIWKKKNHWDLVGQTSAPVLEVPGTRKWLYPWNQTWNGTYIQPNPREESHQNKSGSENVSIVSLGYSIYSMGIIWWDLSHWDIISHLSMDWSKGKS